MYELRLFEQKLVAEDENEPPVYELELVGSFPCKQFEECVDKLVELYEPEMEAVIVSSEDEKVLLKITNEKLVYLDKRFLEEVIPRIPREFLEPDEDELKMCREADKSSLPVRIVDGLKLYDSGNFLFTEDCGVVIRINWP